MTAIWKRELKAYFENPLGYVFLAVYDLFAGYFFFRYNLYGNSTDMRGLFEMLFTVTIFLIPVLTMRLISEDRKSRTDQILYMSPVTTCSIVTAKFLAALTVYAAAVGITVVMAYSISFFAAPEWPVVWGHVVGLFLLGMALISIGLLISALTEHQIIAAIGGFCIGFFMMMLDSLSVSVTNQTVSALLVNLSFQTHYRSFTLGVCSASDVIFFISITAFFLFLTICAFDQRRLGGIKGTHGILIALAAVMVLLVNSITGVLAERYPMVIDLTRNKAFELEEETLRYIKDLDEPVTIQVLATEKRFVDTGTYNAQANEIMQQFAKQSEAITIEYIDYVKTPGFSSAYPDLTMKHGDVLVKGEEKHRLVKTEELFRYTFAASGVPVIESSKAEQAVAMAILYVTSKEVTRVAILTGHGEEKAESFLELLKYNNMQLTEKQLATGTLEDTIDLVFLAAPKTDYSEAELDELEAFLVNGGNYGKTLFYCADAQQPELPLLEGFLKEWGVEIGDGVVFETDENRVYQYQPFYGIVDYVNPEYADGIKQKDASVLMPVSRPLHVLFQNRERYGTDVLLQFGGSSGVRPSDAGSDFKAEEAKEKGPIPVLVLCSYQLLDQQNAGTAIAASHVLVSGSVRMLDEVILNTDTFTNASYLMGTLNRLCQRESELSIRDKTLAGTSLNLTRQSADRMGNLFVFIIPICVIGFGCGVWLLRRYR